MVYTCRRTVLAVSVVTFATIFFLSACGSSNSSLTQSSPQPTTLGAAVDKLVQAQMQENGIPAMTVALAKKGQMLYVRGYGTSDLATGSPNQSSTVFEIGSITKQFTAALIMQLQEQGKLHIDDSAVSYLPGYSFASAITIRMLLNQTSGLADFTNFGNFGHWVLDGISEPDALTEIAHAGLQFTPGSQYAYSNSNYYLLGSIIEKVSGEGYAVDLQQNIFTPLALKNTFYDLPPASVAASGYTHRGATLLPATIWKRSAAFAAGALSSNVYDLAAWDYALMSGKVVSAPSFQAMTSSNGFYQDSYSYGFGLALSTYNGRKLMWHAGQIGGFYTENVVFLDNGFTLIILTNDQDYDTDPFVFTILNAVCLSAQLSKNC
jgi:CubicO group peptidase (beta-lactamase class C family)